MSCPLRRNAQRKTVLDFHRRPLEKPMRRREFITFIGATLAAYPLTVGAQQNERARRIAVLSGVADDAEGQTRLAAFRKGMHDLGWSEGRDMQMEVRFGSGDADRTRAYGAELIRWAPDVILANGSLAVARSEERRVGQACSG